MKDLKLLQYHILFLISDCTDIVNKPNKFTILSQFLEKNLKCSFAFSMMKNIVVFSPQSRFLVQLISCIDFGSASSACC